MSEIRSDSSIREALRYLRENAIAAHRLGDGLLVSHLASTAILRVKSHASNISDPMLRGDSLLWAFVLGLYWSVDNHFDYLVDESIHGLPAGALDDATRSMVLMMSQIVQYPHSEHDWSNFVNPTHETWKIGTASHANQTERIIGYGFLIELAWYEDPKSEIWSKLLDCCKSTCGSDQIVTEFTTLQIRLNAQASLFEGHVTIDEGLKSSLSDTEIRLLKAWHAHFNSDHEEVGLLLSTIRPTIGIENSLYPNFFSLVHQTRFYLTNSEDQFISLPRYRYAISRQPARVIADKRENAAIEATKELAVASFSQDVPATERWTRFRMAMLLQLQALRSWDLGEWFRGLSIRGEARIELARFNYRSMVLDGFFDLLLATGTTRLDKSEFHQQVFKLADTTSEIERSDFVKRLLNLPKRYWPGVADIVSALSDAIPDNAIPLLVEWSLRLEETTPICMYGRQSYLRMWIDLIEFARDPASIVRQLAPALIKVARNPMFWDQLHGLFCRGIHYCDIEESAKILTALGELSYDPHFSRWRYSIVFNALKLKPELSELAYSILKRDLGETPSPYQWLLLDRDFDRLDVARPAAASKEALRSRILVFLNERSNLNGPSISMMSTNFASEFDFYCWQLSEQKLVESLCEFVQDKNTFYSDKIDLLSCLAKLAELGPKKQRKQISKWCIQMLFTGVPGRNFGFEQQQDPMSGFRVKNNVISSVFKLLLDVIQACMPDNEKETTDALLQWLPTVEITQRAEFSSCIHRLLLSLIMEHAPKNENLALVLVGHLEAVFTAVSVKRPVSSVYMFHSILFGENGLVVWEKSKSSDIWRKTLLAQWSNHLTRLAIHIDPEVRRVTAEAITKWINAKLEFSDNLSLTLEILKKDPRNRVRNATVKPKP